MSEYTPIMTEGKTDRELLLDVIAGVQATHSCLDSFRADQETVNKEAATKREEMAGQINTITQSVGEIGTRQDIDSGRITKLAKLFGAEHVEPGEEKPKGKGVATWSWWKVAGTLAGSLTGAAAVYRLMVAIAPAVWDATVGIGVALHHGLLSLAGG